MRTEADAAFGMNLGARWRFAREQAGLSLEQAAARLGYAAEVLETIEEYGPVGDSFAGEACAYAVSECWLLGHHVEIHPSTSRELGRFSDTSAHAKDAEVVSGAVLTWTTCAVCDHARANPDFTLDR